MISDSVTTIGLSAFHGCLSLLDIKFGNGLISLHKAAFDSHKFFQSNGKIQLPYYAEYLRGNHFVGETAGKMILQQEILVTFDSNGGLCRKPIRPSERIGR